MCGIVGFYPKKDKSVDLNKLIILALGNEERGKDNAGIAIGNVYYDKSDGGIDAKNFLVTRLEKIKEIDLTNQAKGVYFIKVYDQHNNVFGKKMVIN